MAWVFNNKSRKTTDDPDQKPELFLVVAPVSCCLFARQSETGLTSWITLT